MGKFSDVITVACPGLVYQQHNQTFFAAQTEDRETHNASMTGMLKTYEIYDPF